MIYYYLLFFQYINVGISVVLGIDAEENSLCFNAVAEW